MTTETVPSLPDALRMMAEGVKPVGVIWDAPELMRIAATEIERLRAALEDVAVEKTQAILDNELKTKNPYNYKTRSLIEGMRDAIQIEADEHQLMAYATCGSEELHMEMMRHIRKASHFRSLAAKASKLLEYK